ncbi:AEC family transporter [Rubrimonas sp.]|uniref:AEC family transporter n=1 Tax=Rubrimonas sp. TaxID=2036015 RepID=UPI002FDE53D8
MLGILTTVLPVFLLVGAGWLAARFGGFPASAVAGLMSFAVRFAVPVLLFGAMARLDLAQAFDRDLLASFYAGSLSAFVLGIALARTAFGRRPGEAVALGFCAMFSNTLLLGVPILSRAEGGADALPAAFAIIALHAPVGYLVGIVTMELSRRDGAGALQTAQRAGKAIFSNALTLGIASGLALNLSGIAPPEFFMAAVDMLGAAALPAALFGLGGALTGYRLKEGLAEAATMAGLSILLHPAIAWLLGAVVFDLPEAHLRAAVVLAAMPTGMNGYVFAAMYNRAQGAAASTVLLGTAASVLSATFWLWLLG